MRIAEQVADLPTSEILEEARHSSVLYLYRNYLCSYDFIYTAPFVMLLMRAASITWANGRGLGPVPNVLSNLEGR
jgi:hypothetical protein